MARHQFKEWESYEAGFADYYNTVIQSSFDSLKQEEQKHRRGGKRWALTVLLFGSLPITGSAWLGYGPMEGQWWPPVFVGLIVLFVAVIGLAASSDAMDHTAQSEIVPLLVSFLRRDGGSLAFVPNPAKDFVDTDTFGELRLFFDTRRSNEAEVTRGIEGERHGVTYRIAQVSLKHSGSDSDNNPRQTTLFSGGLLEVDLPDDIKGRMPLTVFCSNRDGLGAFGALLNIVKSRETIAGQHMERLTFPDQNVEAVYDTYTADAAAAQRYLPPGFGRVLLDIAEDVFGQPRHLAAAFLADKMIVALPASEVPHRLKRDFLDLRIFNQDEATFENELHAALADIALPQRVIDRLLAS